MTSITRRHVLAAGIGALASACVSGTRLTSIQLAPDVPLLAYPAPWLGLNVITYGAIDPAILQHLAALGPLTLRCPVQSLGQAITVLQAVAAFPSLRVVLLVEGMNDLLVANLSLLTRSDTSQLQAIALGNELDLAGVSAADAHDWTVRSYATLRGAGWTGDLYSPSIYCVQPDHLQDYAFPLWQHLPDDMVFDLHRYGDPFAGQDGYASRRDEIQTIRNMIGPDRRVVISEVGWPTRSSADVEWAVRAAHEDRAAAQQLGAIGWCYYQLLDGTGMGDIDHYGLRAIDGTWKGLERVFA